MSGTAIAVIEWVYSLKPQMRDARPNRPRHANTIRVVPLEEPLHFIGYAVWWWRFIMNLIIPRVAANNAHHILAIRPAHRHAGQLFRDGHRLPRTQYFVCQGVVPSAPHIDNEARSASRLQVDAGFGLGHNLAEMGQQRRSHRVAIQVLPLDGARGDRLGQHECNLGVGATLIAHRLHIARQSLGCAMERLNPVRECPFVDDEVRPVRMFPCPHTRGLRVLFGPSR